jgi:hypothetical protein
VFLNGMFLNDSENHSVVNHQLFCHLSNGSLLCAACKGVVRRFLAGGRLLDAVL